MSIEALKQALESAVVQYTKDGNNANLQKAVSQAIAEAEKQEPVLWLVNGVVQSSDIPKDFTGCLYTSPPQRQPLTDEQKMAELLGTDLETYLRFKEWKAAHGIKETS